jgi:hypothetical protein
MCEFINRPKYQRDRDYENNEPPLSPKDTYCLLREMALKIKSLETKVTKLESSERTKKTKVITQWLAANPKTRPERTLLEWTAQFDVDDTCLDMVYRENIFDAVQYCIKREFTRFKEDNAPIRAFSQKPNTIYVYITDDKNPESRVWKILGTNELERWIAHITQRFLVEFTKKQGEKIDEIYNNRKEEERHNIMMLKLNGKLIPSNELKKWLIPKIETNIQTMIEYEFV